MAIYFHYWGSLQLPVVQTSCPRRRFLKALASGEVLHSKKKQRISGQRNYPKNQHQRTRVSSFVPFCFLGNSPSELLGKKKPSIQVPSCTWLHPDRPTTSRAWLPHRRGDTQLTSHWSDSKFTSGKWVVVAEAYENDCRIFILYVQKCIRIYIMCCFVSSVFKDPVDVQDNDGQLFRCKSQTLLAVVPSKA